jgi:hypothetical protein
MFQGATHLTEVVFRNDMSAVLVTGAEGKKVVFDEENPDAKRLLAELAETIARSFCKELDESMKAGATRHLQNHDSLVILYDKHGPAGFASGFSKEELLDLHGIAIAPRAKGSGAARIMLNLLRSASGAKGITFTTQNPVMFRLLRSICTTTYPNPQGNVPEVLQSHITMLTQGRPGLLSPATGVIRDLYSHCLYPVLPESRDLVVNEWFSRMLETYEGRTRNAFIFLGQGFR